MWLHLTLLLVNLLGGHYCDDDGTRNCKDIQSLNQAIYWIGLLKSRFILISSTYAVFDMSPSVVDNVNHKVYLSDSLPLEKAYPTLGEKKNHDASGFFGDGHLVHKRLAVTDETGEYLYAESEQLKRGMLYDFGKKTVDEYDIKDEMTNGGYPLITLSSVEVLHFYAIYFSSKSDASGQLLLGRFAERNTLRESTTLQQQGDTFHLCLVGTTGDQIKLSKESCADGTADWSPVGGFADKYNFYVLATNRTVMVFPTSAIGDAGTPVRVTKVRYEDFFVCGSNGAAGSWVVFAIIGVIFGLILLGGCCFFLCRQRGRGALIGSQKEQQQSMSAKQQQQQQQPVGLNPFAATQQQLQQPTQQPQGSSKSKSQKTRKSKNRSKSGKRSNKSRKSTKKKGSKKH